jgi:hypothetical protein
MKKKENDEIEMLEKAIRNKKRLEHDRRINFSSDDVYDTDNIKIYRRINPDIFEYVMNDNNRD